MEEARSIVIIGGGVTGLSLGAYMKDAGFNCIILEKGKRPGGVIQSVEENGYIFDVGANSTSSNLAFEQMVDILGLRDEVIAPTENFKKRYILKKKKLKHLNPKPSAFMTSSLLSGAGKKGILTERFKTASTTMDDESVGTFFERRFGKEIVDYIINPVLAGIYAGDPYKLGMQSVMPKIAELEARYGSLTKAIKKEKDFMPKREIRSFKKGMSTFIDGLVDYIGADDILSDTEVKKVVHNEDGTFSLGLLQEGYSLEIAADVVVFATPAYTTAEFIRPINNDMADLLARVYYPKMMVLQLGFDAKSIKQKLDSFGFLVPEVEKKAFLGAIWNSALFPNRAPEGKKAFTLFIGGVRNEDQVTAENIERLKSTAIDEFMEIMGIKDVPEYVNHYIWDKAIPQMDVGHQSLVESIGMFEGNIKNLHIIGNYRSGLSVADCVLGAKQAHGRLIKDYSRQSFWAAKDAE
ncbi:MAG: protoporphyrinogen oxidase [Saprospiraceae bacterium]|nr:protoporphyrinogen oxidase [Saprospiraceae bacterium]